MTTEQNSKFEGKIFNKNSNKTTLDLEPVVELLEKIHSMSNDI